MKQSLSKNHQRALGIGLGVGLAGAIALAFRYGLKRTPHAPLPEDLSPAIFARRLATTTHGDMVYHISGSGEPVIFLHGIYPGASSFEWSRVYPEFVLQNEVIAADLVGFGESERPASRMDASDYALTLAEFLAEVCGHRKPVVVASGLTAGVALLMASSHPEKVRALVLLLPHTTRPSVPWAARHLSAAARIPAVGRFLYDFSIAREPFLRTWLTRFGYADPAKIDEEVVRNLAVCAQQTGARHALLNVLRGGLSLNLDGRLPTVPHPVHILWPDSAPKMSPELGMALAARLPAATFHLLPGCGTLANLECPRLLVEEIHPFLSKHGPIHGAA